MWSLLLIETDDTIKRRVEEATARVRIRKFVFIYCWFTGCQVFFYNFRRSLKSHQLILAGVSPLLSSPYYLRDETLTLTGIIRGAPSHVLQLLVRGHFQEEVEKRYS